MAGLLMNYRSVWQGLAAEYSAYIFLGSPTPAIGGIYPPMYLAYRMARHLQGDVHAMLDVFAAIHLLNCIWPHVSRGAAAGRRFGAGDCGRMLVHAAAVPTASRLQDRYLAHRGAW